VDTTISSEPRPAWRQYLRALGPGLVTGASDDDPSAIVTYAAAGARTGFGLLWTTVLAFPLMVAAQINADRTALATGRSLGELVRERFTGRARWVALLLVVAHVVACTLVLAADLVAIGTGAELLAPGPAWAWTLGAGLAITLLLLSGSFSTIARVLKLLCLALLGYVGVLLVADVDWGDALHHTLVPSLELDRSNVALLLAVLGATLPPYVFSWQSVHRLEEMREEPEGGDDPVPLTARPAWHARRKERTSALDVVAGMCFAVIVMYAVIVASALARDAGGPATITSAADVARSLEPVAGPAATALFAVGIVAAGALAVPVLAGGGSALLAGLLGRPWGFSRSVREAPAFYGLVAAGTVVGTALGMQQTDPVALLVLAATVNGATAAPLLALVMVLSGDRRLMGEHRCGVVLRVLGWCAVGVMTAAAGGLAITAVLG
jgi:NRAMP (natural resistance-associated macrophage protein)-like metal ion transporter